MSVKRVSSAVPVKADTASAPPVGTAMTLTSALAAAAPLASRALSVNVYVTPGCSAPGSRPSVGVSSGVPTLEASLRSASGNAARGDGQVRYV
jgi:hypothetical protein